MSTDLIEASLGIFILHFLKTNCAKVRQQGEFSGLFFEWNLEDEIQNSGSRIQNQDMKEIGNRKRVYDELK